MPGTPPTTPNLGIPRPDNADTMDFATEVNAALDHIDSVAAPAATAPTADEKAALAGTAGSPAAGDKFVTDSDPRNADARVPTAHHATHAPGGSDAITGLTDASIASANKDGSSGTPSMRTLGTGSQQAAPGNDGRFPTAAQGSALAGTSGTPGAGNKYVTDADARMADARTPTAHAASHAPGGSDPVAGLGAAPPVGSVMAYTGQGDPAGGQWVVCDGRLIDRTTYAAFYAATGHAYNGGVDPGSNRVRIPDKRGRVSRGAVNMGTGAAPNDNTHSQAARGASGGEVAHTLSAGESGLPAHGHGVTDPGHNHVAEAWSVPGGATVAKTGGAIGGVATSTSPGLVELPQAAGGTWGGGDLNHSHVIDAHATGVTVNAAAAAAAGAGHNNLSPYECDSFIVRVA